MASDEKRDDEVIVPDPDSDEVPPPRAARLGRRRQEDDYDERDDRDDDYHPRGRTVHYDDDGYEITSDQSMWALFAHIGVFFVGFLAPLIILIVHRDKSPFVVRHAKESLNHQISLTLLIFSVALVAAILGFGLYFATQEPAVGLIVGVVLFELVIIAVSIFNIVTLILGTIAAAKYRPYRYPFTLRLIG